MKSKTLVAAATAAALALAGLTAGVAATTASAASSGKAGGVSAPNVVFHKGQTSKKLKVAYRSKISNWQIDTEITDPRGNLFDVDFDYGSKPTKRTYSTWFYDWDRYGRYVVEAQVSDDDYNVRGTYRDVFNVKRATYLNVNATPEPVRKGKHVTVKGTAKYWDPSANYGDGKIKPLKSKTVKISFDPAGKKKPVYKGSDKVNRKGIFSRKFRQTTNGTWIVKYAGTSTLTPDTTKDYVRVKR